MTTEISNDELLELLSLSVTTDERGHTTYKNSAGKIHRIYGPAIIMKNGSKRWLKNGKHHRTDGPAVDWHDGLKEFWIDGNRVSENDPRLQLQ